MYAIIYKKQFTTLTIFLKIRKRKRSAKYKKDGNEENEGEFGANNGPYGVINITPLHKIFKNKIFNH